MKAVQFPEFVEKMNTPRSRLQDVNVLSAFCSCGRSFEIMEMVLGTGIQDFWGGELSWDTEWWFLGRIMDIDHSTLS